MNKAALLATAERIRPHIHRTAVHRSQQINSIAACEILFKCENFQRMGAFKMRGALNAVLCLSKEQQQRGVVTHSSGNFAQALALSARIQGISAHIVMPKNAPEVKKRAVVAYGGIVHECASTQAAREAAAEHIVQEKGCTFIHPYNMDNVILGQGTAAMEFIEDHPDLDILLTPVGGGGLLSGSALAAKHFGKGIRVFAGEPFGADDAFRSIEAGRLLRNESVETLADGLRTNLGDKTFPIIQEHVEGIIRVEEDEIIDAMRLIWERMKLIVEPSSAVPLAAVLKEPKLFRNKCVGIILSGGNVELSALPF